MSATSLSRESRKVVWTSRPAAVFIFALLMGSTSAFAAGNHRRPAATVAPGAPNTQANRGKLDRELSKRSAAGGTSKVIVTLQPGATVPPEFARYTKANGRLNIINGQVMEVPNSILKRLAAHPNVFKIDVDRPIGRSNFRTALTIGSPAVHSGYGYTGAGITVAVIDSGITSWHDDLTNNSSTQYPYGNQRVAAFVDFVNGQTQPYDDDGHGTHVAGIIAGNGYDSNGQKAGVAPDASLVSLKVLDGNGNGTISNIIGAFDWVVAHHAEYNIRVVNASVGASISESYWTDPLTLAAKRVVDEGVVVVTAAGNVGLNGAGQTQYGGITAPGNAPWVITVGASSTNGTPRRDDDTMGSFSSRGPTFKDWGAKPDLVAPGVGTISLANPQSNYYTTRAQALVPGSLPTAFTAYLSLSGTSMASPVVAGTVALMLQANPSLTPNAVKAILEYTAETHADYDALTQGAGFLNTLGAVRLARFYAGAQPGDTVPVQAMWSKHVLWGNHMLHGGILNPAGNAFGVGVNWGVSKSDDGDNIVWGTDCSSADCDNIVWGTDDGDNIVWGTSDDGDNIVWGTSADGDNIVWGTDCGGADCDNIVWGTDDGDNIVWGTAEPGDNIVWGTVCANNVCDGSSLSWASDDGDNIVWGTDDGDNIVWGTADGDNIVWGTDDGDNIVWGTSANGVTNWAGGNGNVVAGNFQGLLKHKTDEQIFAILEQVVSGPPPSALPAAPTTNNDPLQLPPSDPATTSNDPLQLPPPDPNVIDPSLAPPPPALSPDPIVVNQSLPCDPTVALCTAPPCDPTTTACTSTGGGL